jgi:hypothetical protein
MLASGPIIWEVSSRRRRRECRLRNRKRRRPEEVALHPGDDDQHGGGEFLYRDPERDCGRVTALDQALAEHRAGNDHEHAHRAEEVDLRSGCGSRNQAKDHFTGHQLRGARDKGDRGDEDQDQAQEGVVHRSALARMPSK